MGVLGSETAVLNVPSVPAAWAPAGCTKRTFSRAAFLAATGRCPGWINSALQDICPLVRILSATNALSLFLYLFFLRSTLQQGEAGFGDKHGAISV